MSANSTIFAVRKRRELSSAGSEHLPYKQGVTGSNPVAPTTTRHMAGVFFLPWTPAHALPTPSRGVAFGGENS